MPEKPENFNEAADGGLRLTTCSPSSTPETESMLNFLSKEWPDRGDFEIALAGFARKLERERDEWREKAERRSIFVTTTGDALDSVLTAIRAYRDAKGRYHTQKACERLLTFLPENDERMHHYQRRRTSITGLVL